MEYVANNPTKRKIKIQEEDGTLRDATPHDLNDAGFVKSPDKRVFNINVGSMEPKAIEEFTKNINKMIDSKRRDITIDLTKKENELKREESPKIEFFDSKEIGDMPKEVWIAVDKDDVIHGFWNALAANDFCTHSIRRDRYVHESVMKSAARIERDKILNKIKDFSTDYPQIGEILQKLSFILGDTK